MTDNGRRPDERCQDMFSYIPLTVAHVFLLVPGSLVLFSPLLLFIRIALGQVS